MRTQITDWNSIFCSLGRRKRNLDDGYVDALRSLIVKYYQDLSNLDWLFWRGGISCDFRIRLLARNVQISEEVNHLMLSTSNTCNCVVSSPEMASSCKGKVIVLMGVSGAGKSTIGSILGRAVHGRFLDADDYHSASNKEKMRNGIPLCDEDRVPWLKTLRDVLRIGLINNETLILACSALQKQYREILRSADPNYEPGSYTSVVKLVLLDIGAEVLAARLDKRAAEGKHFMPAKLLQTQLALLQIDEAEGIFKIDATLDPDNIVKTIQTFVI